MSLVRRMLNTMHPEVSAPPEGAGALSMIRQSSWASISSLGWLPYLAASIMAIAMRLPTLTPNVVFIDEPSYIVQVQRLDTFYKFIYAFQYRLETKFQLGLVPYAVALYLGHDRAILLVHVFAALSMVVSGCFLVAISRLVFRTVMPGLFSLFILALYSNRNVFAAASVLECFQLPLLLWGAWLYLNACLLAERHEGTSTGKRLLLAGMAFGLAALVKPPGLLVSFVAAFGLLLAPAPWYRPVPGISEQDRPGSWRQEAARRGLQCSLLLAGSAFPIGLAVLPYLLNPPTLTYLQSLLGNASTYTTAYGGSLDDRVKITIAILEVTNLILLVITIVPFLAFRFLLRKKPSVPLDQARLFLLLAGGVLFAGYSVGQAKPHYLVAVLPFLMLFVGYQLYVARQALPVGILRSAAPLVILAWILCSERSSFQFYASWLTTGGDYQTAESARYTESLVMYIKAHTSPDDSIWVYYNAPEVYWLSGRKPATDEPTGSWLVHDYNQYWFNRTKSELLRDTPALIAGIDYPHYPMPVASLQDLPNVGQLIAQRYRCSDSLVPHATVCLRNGQ